MTKAFLNWLISLGPKPEGWSEYEVLRAFVKEINRREDECDNSGLGCPYESRSQCRGDKLRSVVRDFGLDSKEHRQPSADSDFMAANDEEGSK